MYIVIDFELKCREPLFKKMRKRSGYVTLCSQIQWKYYLPQKGLKAGMGPKIDVLHIGNFVCLLIHYKLILIGFSDNFNRINT